MEIAIYGAAGHTARFVLAELLRRGHTPIAVGSDEAKVTAAVALHGVDVAVRVASIDSAPSLDRALAGVDAVINCAGPFLDSAAPLINAALRGRIHYFDLTAEQTCALSTFEEFDEPARGRGIVVVPAVAFYGSLGDVLATAAMRDWTHADRIDLAVALDSWWPTRGTRRTGRRNTAPRLTFTDGRLTQVVPSAPRSWSFPEPFGTQDVTELPFTETILMARHLPATEIHNYLNNSSLADMRDAATPEPVAADERGRSNQRFLVDAVVRSGDEERRATVEGRDIYAITAPLVVEAVERICGNSAGAGGAFALGQLVDASEFLRALAQRGELTLTSDRKAAPGGGESRRPEAAASETTRHAHCG